MKAYKSAESDDVKIIQCLVGQQNRRQKICFWCQETKVSIVIMTPEIADDYFFIKNQEMEIMLLKRFSQYYFWRGQRPQFKNERKHDANKFARGQ